MPHTPRTFDEPTVSAILSRTFDQPMLVGPPMLLRDRTDVCRFEVLNGNPTIPSSVVVKVVAATDPSDRTRMEEFFFNEWAGLTLLQDLNVDPPLAPRVYGADPVTGMLVMEDLGMAPTLWEALQDHDSPLAISQFIALATALGRMHAYTIGQEPRLEKIRHRLSPNQPSIRIDDYGWMQPTVEQITVALHIPVSKEAMEDLGRLRQLLSGATPFWAYTQGDPSPGNCLFVAPTMRVFDFGVGAYRHACVDFPPPWCWGRTSPEVLDEMCDAYQQALAQGSPAAAAPQRFAEGLVEGSAYWSVTLLKDWPLAEVAANEGMRRNLLAVLRHCADISRQTAHLEAFGALIGAVSEAIVQRWPVERSSSA